VLRVSNDEWDCADMSKIILSINISDNVSVVEHSLFELCPVSRKRDISGSLIRADAINEELKFAFSISYPNENGSLSTLHCSTSVEIVRSSWIQQIELSKAEVAQALRLKLHGEDHKHLVDWRLSKDALLGSPNIRVLLAIRPSFRIKSTGLCKIKGLYLYFLDYSYVH
jgi:hypothetical protein